LSLGGHAVVAGCLAALLGLPGACAPSAPARAGAEATVSVSHLTPPDGVTLVAACTPSGPELCFNAVDDNCNGVIDEGCGIQTGLFQFTIAWSVAAADVNLTLVTPSQERVPADRKAKPRSPSGFELDRDCPEDGCAGQNEENIFLEGGPPPAGRYQVEIALADLHGADAPIRVRFGARLGAREVGFDVDLAPGQDARKVFTFEVP
jgi:tRNA (guanosine-2'-O-)-methyltransferase